MWVEVFRGAPPGVLTVRPPGPSTRIARTRRHAMAEALYKNRLTIITSNLPAKEHALRQALREINDEVEENALIPLLRC